MIEDIAPADLAAAKTQPLFKLPYWKDMTPSNRIVRNHHQAEEVGTDSLTSSFSVPPKLLTIVPVVVSYYRTAQIIGFRNDNVILRTYKAASAAVMAR